MPVNSTRTNPVGRDNDDVTGGLDDACMEPERGRQKGLTSGRDRPPPRASGRRDEDVGAGHTHKDALINVTRR